MLKGLIMINLLFCGNLKVFKGILLCCLSICKHTSEPLNVYILTADLSHINSNYKPIANQNATLLENILQKTNKKSKVNLVKIGNYFEKWIFESKNKNNPYTPFAFLRLFADTVKLPNKILYLDTDIMACGNIKELFNTNITNLEFAVVKDHLGKFFIKHNYFNSGVMLMNLTKMKQTNILEKARNICQQKKMAFPDQSALNKLAKYITFLPRKFNEQRNPKKDTILQHFCKRIQWLPFPKTINIKPWQIEKVKTIYKINNYNEIFKDYLNIINNSNF